MEHEVQLETLESKADRLFSGNDDVEVWKSDGVDLELNNKLKREQFSWATHDTDRNFYAYLIHQRSSWGYLQISKETLQKLLSTHKLSPVIIDATFSFGAKVTNDDDPYFNLCHRQVCSLDITQSPDNGRYYDLCYISRCFEKHGRSNLKQPWSLRQMMVYQRYYVRSHKSIWVLIQPFKKCKDSLMSHYALTPHPMSAHASLLTLTLYGWRWYLNDVRLTLTQYTEKATNSSLKPKEVDYDTDFKDCQDLQLVCQNLQLAQTILDSSLDVAMTIRQQCTDLSYLDSDRFSNDDEIYGRCQLEIQKIKSFRRGVEALLEQAKQTMQLLLKLLDARKIDIQNSHTEALRNIAIASNAQGDVLHKLAEKTHRDSRSVKTLTFIAMVYVPASLVAAIYSTDLVQVPKTAGSHDSSLPVISKAMWTYALASLVLTAITLAAIYCYDNHKIWGSVRRLRRPL